MTPPPSSLQPTMSLERIEVELPQLRTIESVVREAGQGPDQVPLLRNSGLRQVPVAPPGRLADLIEPAVRRALSDLEPDDLGGGLLAHSVPVTAPMGTPVLEPLLAQLGHRGVPVVAVSGQPCAVLHMAIRLAAGWLSSLPAGSRILVVGADRAYSSKERLFFGSVMGDAAVAIVANAGGERNRVQSSFQHAHLKACQGMLSAADSIAKFRAANPLLIRAAILECLDSAGRSLEDLDVLVPHTPYLAVWEVIARLLEIDRGRILTDYIGETGHLNSNDSFVHYSRAIVEGRIRPGDLALLVNPGFGGTCGCTLILC